MALSKRTRFEVFKRDRFACQYCGRTPPTVVLHVDHIVATANHGSDDPINLVTSCADCNLGKSAVPLDAMHRPLAEQMAEAEERQAQLKAFNALLRKVRAAETAAINRLGKYWFRDIYPDKEYTFGPSRRPSVQRFLKRLPETEILEAIDIAASRIDADERGGDQKRFKYFCGICWTKIRNNDAKGPGEPSDDDV